MAETYSSVLFERLATAQSFADIKTAGRDSPDWGSRVQPQANISSFNQARQFEFIGWYIPKETFTVSMNRQFFYTENLRHMLGGVADGSFFGLGSVPTFYIDVGINGADHRRMVFDLSGIHVLDTPFFYVARYDAYGATDADRARININGVWRTGTVVNGPIPDATAMGSGTMGTKPGIGSGGAAGPLGRIGQARLGWADAIAQDNPGFLTDDEIAELYNQGLGLQTPWADLSSKLLWEYLFEEQTGTTVADSTGNGHPATLSLSGTEWGGTKILTGSGESWDRVSVQDLGSLIAGTPGTAVDLRVRNVGQNRSNVVLYLTAEGGTLEAADLAEVLGWGDGGEGFQVQQKNGPLKGDWGAWASFSNSTATMLLSRYGVDPNQADNGTLPKAKACRFRCRLAVPSSASSRSRRYKPRLGVRYIAV